MNAVLVGWLDVSNEEDVRKESEWICNRVKKLPTIVHTLSLNVVMGETLRFPHEKENNDVPEVHRLQLEDGCLVQIAMKCLAKDV